MIDLYPFQRKGVDRLHAMGDRGLLADDMGLGKSTQALFWHKELNAGPALVVCPASLKYMWQKEAEKMVGASSIVLSSQTPHSELVGHDYDLMIINYEILSYWKKWILKHKLKTIIFDEAHMLSNRSSGRSKVALSLADVTDNVLLLTGTPMMNRPKDLWHLLHIIDPDKWDSFTLYGCTYCEPKFGARGKIEYKGATNLEQLHQEVKPYMVRRRKTEVLKDLPDKTLSVVPVEIEKRGEYDLAVADLKKWLRQQGEEADYTPFVERVVKLGHLKRLAAKLKFKAAMHWLQDWLDSTDEKIVVFGIHKKMMEALERRLDVPLVKVTGSTSKKNRQKAVEDFQSDPNVRVFLGNIEAAGVGLTLTAASTVVFMEMDWRPTLHAQAVDRCHRIGQKNAVVAYYLIAINTIEERLAEVLQTKQQVLSLAIDGKQNEDDIDVFDQLIASL